MERVRFLQRIDKQFKVHPVCALLEPRQVGKTTLAKMYAELDLLVIVKGKRIGFEFKYTERPKITPSMQIAIQDLQLLHLYVSFPGHIEFSLAENITACGLEKIPFLAGIQA